jgi:hypothetical protein
MVSTMSLTEQSLEPAIPQHLATERTCPSKLPSSDYQPIFPAYCARFSESTKGLVIAVIGLQQQETSSISDDHRLKLLGFMRAPLDGSNPLHYDLATYVDPSGYRNDAVFAYWRDPQDYDAWTKKSGFGTFWEELIPSSEVGWFKEVFSPSTDRFETVFSDNAVPEGAAHMRESVSGSVQEHVYWGSMRDRLPISQTDSLEGEDLVANEGERVTDTQSQRVRVAGRKNFCVIRSGQDWSGTNPDERDLYLRTMHHVLIKGMDFLTHEGSTVGCLSNRFMDVIDPSDPSNATDKTFGLGYFDNLASLEGWSKHHKTHLDIFGRFGRYAGELQNNVTLRLFHEVMVLQPDQQFFEYVGCHPRTGLLAGMAADDVS